MWRLLTGEIGTIKVNGKPLYCEINADEGVEFSYGKKKLFVSNDIEENLVHTDADCQRLCDRVNAFFGIE